jgi:hypothetical protein
MDESTVMSEALGVVGAWGVIVIEGVCVCCGSGGEGVALVDWRFCLLCDGGDDVLLCGSVGIVKQM